MNTFIVLPSLFLGLNTLILYPSLFLGLKCSWLVFWRWLLLSQWLSGLRCDQSFVKGTPNLTGAGGQMAFNDSYPCFEMEPVVGAPETILKTFGIFLKLMLL